MISSTVLTIKVIYKSYMSSSFTFFFFFGLIQDWQNPQFIIININMTEEIKLSDNKHPSLEVKEGSFKDSSLAEIQDDATLYIDPAEEAKLVKKLDRYIMPLFSLIYFLSFLDRSNIGNARVAGMQSQLGITDSQFSTAVSIFYATYVTVELPGTLAVKRIGPRHYISFAMIAWSLITIFTCFVRSYGSLLAVRLLLGLVEGSIFPSQNLVITMTYKRNEQNKRIGYLYICSCFSGAFGGLIASGITKIKPSGNFDSWSWLFVIEGLVSLICALLVYIALPNDPKNAKFLNAREKELMLIRAEQAKRYQGNQKFEMKEVYAAWKDPKVWLACIIQFCCDIVLYGFSTFLPSILKLQLGYTSLEAQYLSVPCYVTAAIGVGTISYISDHYGHKYYLLIVGNCFAIIGYILLLVNKKGGVNYFATYMVSIAIYSSVGINLTWMNVNMAPHYRRATALGTNQMFGNVAGAIAGQIYRSSPYKLGNAFSLGCAVVGSILGTVLKLYLDRENKIKEQILNGEREDHLKERTGDKELTFKYST